MDLVFWDTEMVFGNDSGSQGEEPQQGEWLDKRKLDS